MSKKTLDLESAPRQVRIIAGRWRGTKLPVVLKEGVRPTPNRVKETLFNWLQPQIEGSHCLDLFAGSGALGLEAVSRGATQATLVDSDAQIIALLSQQVEKLRAHKDVRICHDDAYAYLEKDSNAFDIIFLDPPFSIYHPEQLLQQLLNSACIKLSTCIYLETAAEKFPQIPPKSWQWRRQLKAGQVECGLLVAN